MTITTRQEKIQATINRQYERLAKLEAKLAAPVPEKEINKFIKSYNEINEQSIRRHYVEPCTRELAIERIRKNYEYDIRCIKENIEDNEYKLGKAKEADEREEKRNAKREAEQSALSEIPEVLKSFGELLVKNTFADRLRLHKWAVEQGYPRYNDRSEKANAIRRHYEFNEESTLKEIRRTVEALLLNLVDRVAKKCGKIVNASNLTVNAGNWLEGQAINGWIEGENGKARVYSIVAGGYNIQCLHVRVLVK